MGGCHVKNLGDFGEFSAHQILLSLVLLLSWRRKETRYVVFWPSLLLQGKKPF